MKIINSKDVTPKTMDEGEAKGVELREMITEKHGAQNFALRVLNLKPLGQTPFHSHAWEHEVYVLSGNGKVKSENGFTEITNGSAVFIPGNEKHCFVAKEEGLSFVCVIPVGKACCIDK